MMTMKIARTVKYRERLLKNPNTTRIFRNDDVVAAVTELVSVASDHEKRGSIW